MQLKQKVNNGQTTYDIKLNPDVNLKGEGENTGKRVWLSGSNGTITATTNSNSEEERTVINGGNVYVGNSVSVGANDDVVITDKDITGLSNTTWDETLADKVEKDNVLKGTAATQGQLLDVQEAVDTATTLAGKHTIVTVNDGISAPELEEGQTEGTYSKDGNLQLKQKVNDGQTTYDVKLNSVVTLDGNESDNNKVVLDGNNGTISVTNKYVDTDSKPIKTIANTFNFDNEGATFINTTKNGKGNGNGNPVTSFTNIDGGIITVSSDARKDKKDIVIDGDTGEITGLSNTEWEGTTITPDRAATEGQLQSVATEAAKHTTVSGDENITVNHEEGSQNYRVTLNDNVYLGGNHTAQDNNIILDGENGVIGLGSTIALDGRDGTAVIGGVNITTTAEEGTGKPVSTINGLSNTTWTGTTETPNRAATEGQLQSAYDGSVKYWKKQDGTYDKSFIQLEGGEKGTTITHLKDGVVAEHSTEAINGSQLWETQQQIKDVETTASKHTIVSTPEDSNLTVKNVAEKGEADNYQVTLNDDIILGDYFNNGDGVLISGKSGTISATNSITVGEDQGLVIDGQKKTVQGLSNTTWTGTTETPNRAATEGQLQSAYDGSVKYWKKQDGTYDKSFIQLEGGEKGTTITHLKDGVVAEHSTEAINGSQLWETQQQIKDVETTASKHTIVSTPEDSNLTVKNVAEKGEAANYQVALKDDITLKGDSSSIELTGTKGTIQVNQETAEGTNFTNINGNVVSIGYTNSEGIENAIVIDGGKGTITGLSNTTWDDELAKQVADSEELQSTAATQGQLQQAVSEVATEAGKHTTVTAGDDNLIIDTSTNTNGGTNYEVSLGHNITLHNVVNTNEDKPKEAMLVFNTDLENEDGISGYIPDNYKDNEGDISTFVQEHGGFAIYYANPSDTTGDMTGTFGVTTDGVVHAKDVISYYSASSGSQSDVIRYSLNDVGDIVTQIAHGKFDGTGMEYTLISDFTSEEDKDTPFVSTDNPQRTIGLAVRQDGAVVVGAVVDKSGNLDDSGIRINAETDSDGNNKATITGLENTEWKPKAPEQTPQAKMATFAANDGTTTTETSRAATEAQLDDLYSSVAVYNTFDENGNVSYDTIILRGDKYNNPKVKASDEKPTGGTLITNLAYATGNGSDAVNVDYLNDAIAGVKTEASGSDKYLSAGAYDQESGKITLTVANSQDVVIDGIASKVDISNLNGKITDINNQITDIKNQISGGTGTGGNNNTTITGGKINDDGTISLDKNNGESSITLEGQLTGSSVIQDGTKFDGESGTLTIMTQNDYGKDKVQTPITVEGIASKDDIEAVNDTIGATSKEDLKDKYKDTEYLKDENGETVETLADADIALDHAVQGLVTNDKYLNSRIDNVEKRLGDVEQRIDKVGAMAAAIANLRTMGFDPEAPTEIAVGVGQYKSETGLAIGVFHYPNQDFMLSASLSTSGDEVMGGIGATWRIGRKTAAEKAKDEEKRILAKAEEIKQAAKRAEVKAQADRHAKLLAEREAKGESIRPIENKVEQTQEQA